MPGRLRIGAGVSGAFLEGSHRVEDDQVEPGAVEVRQHATRQQVVDFDLRVSLGLSDRVAFEPRLPIRLARTDATFKDADGTVAPGFASIHHRDETLFGLGDLEIASRFRLLKPTLSSSWTLDFTGGVTLPTGDTEPNPFALGRAGETHQHIFFGSGTVDPIGGLAVSTAIDQVVLSSWLTTRLTLFDNRKGYQAGDKVSAGIAIQSAFGLESLSFLLGPELYHEQPATWERGREQARNSGRTDVIAAAGVLWRPSPAVSLELLVRKPFTVKDEGGQIDIPILVGAGATFTFMAWGDTPDSEDDHAHEHGGGEHDDTHDGEHDHGDDSVRSGVEPDVVDVATGGNTFEIQKAIEPGKVTVIDFWAEWCHPCLHIDALLRKLAGQHGDLAVRRVEIVDSDSPVVSQHLADAAGLPVVWIYDRHGKRVATLVTTTAAQVEERLRKLLSEGETEP